MQLGPARTVFLAGVLVVPSGVASRATASPGADTLAPTVTPEVQLVWIDAGRTGVSGSKRVTDEIQALLGSPAARLVSTAASPGESVVVGGGWIRVVLLPVRDGHAPRGRTVGGQTCSSPGEQPTIWVVPASVAATVGLRLDASPCWDLLARRRFDLALAVVVAHEIVHLVGHAPHSSGLMAARLEERDLLARPALPPEARAPLAAGLDALARAPRLVRAAPGGEPVREARR